MNLHSDNTTTSVRIYLASTVHITTVMTIVSRAIDKMRTQGIDQWDEVYPDTTTIATDIAQRALYVAEQNGSLVGTIVLNELQEMEYAAVPWHYCYGPTLVIHRLCIDPSHQGQGVARMLMEFAEQYAMEHSYRTIRLDAFTGNPAAVGLYERLGYRHAGQVTFRKGAFHCFEKPVAILT